MKSKERAALTDVGLKVDSGNTISRNRHFGPKEAYLCEWFQNMENSTFSPLINKGKDGKFKKDCVKYRVLCHNRGYEKYKWDVQKNHQPYYSRWHFYQQSQALGFRDDKMEQGLCTNCVRYGDEVWEKLKYCIAIATIQCLTPSERNGKQARKVPKILCSRWRFLSST